jgi:hypothetical protein
MILRLLCICLVFYSLLSSLMHGTMNLKFTYSNPANVLCHKLCMHSSEESLQLQCNLLLIDSVSQNTASAELLKLMYMCINYDFKLSLH